MGHVHDVARRPEQLQYPVQIGDGNLVEAEIGVRRQTMSRENEVSEKMCANRRRQCAQGGVLGIPQMTGKIAFRPYRSSGNVHLVQHQVQLGNRLFGGCISPRTRFLPGLGDAGDKQQHDEQRFHAFLPWQSTAVIGVTKRYIALLR